MPGGAAFLAGVFVDAMGSGLWLPFSVLYFNLVLGLPLPLVGLGLTLGPGIALLLVPTTGAVIDRLGPRKVCVGSQLLRGVAFASYLFIHGFLPFLAVTMMIAVGSRAYLSSTQALVAQHVASADRDRWYGMSSLVSNAAAGSGSLLAGLLVALGQRAGYELVAGLNAVSFFLGALLISRVPPAGSRGASAEGGYRELLADRSYLRFVLLCPLLGLSIVALQVGLPPFVVQYLGAPPWSPGLLFALCTAMVLIGQMPALAAVRAWSRARALAAASLAYAIGYGLLVAAPLVPRPLLLLYLALAIGVYTVGELVFVPVSAALAAASAPAQFRGRYLAAYQLSVSTGRTAGPVIFAGLLATMPPLVWLLLVLLASLTAGGMLRLEAPLARRAA